MNKEGIKIKDTQSFMYQLRDEFVEIDDDVKVPFD